MSRPKKHFPGERYRLEPMKPTPTEQRMSELPHGDGNWPGADVAWARLQRVSQHLASDKNTHLSDDHIHTMAVMGCGHEETTKAWVMYCIDRGWPVLE